MLSFIVIIVTRTYLGDDAFNTWGWRIPILFSFLLMAIAFSSGSTSRSRRSSRSSRRRGDDQESVEGAFLSANIKYVLIATVVVLGEGVVWYSGQFWALYFLGRSPSSTP